MENVSVQQQIWIKEYQSTHSTEVRDELILSLMPIVYSICDKYKGFSVETHDLSLVGIEAIMIGIDKYDVASKTKISSYLYRLIENKILKEIRKSTAKKRTGKVISLDYDLSVDSNDKDFTAMDCLLSYDPNIANKVTMSNDIENAIQELPELQQQVITYRFGLMGKRPHNQNEIADILKVHKSSVSRWEKVALNKLKELLGSYRVEV